MNNNKKIRRCFLKDNIHITFHCNQCDKWHLHGRAGSLGEGHRSAHCFDGEDYNLKLFTDKERKEIIRMAEYTIKEKKI